jgi:hypothetical protein
MFKKVNPKKIDNMSIKAEVLIAYATPEGEPCRHPK